MDPQLQYLQKFPAQPFVFEQPAHMIVHIRPILVDLRYRWTAEVPTVRPYDTGPFGFVIAVEHKIVTGIENPVPGQIGSQYKRFEKPGRVSQMPFGRAHIPYGLYHIILDL